MKKLMIFRFSLLLFLALASVATIVVMRMGLLNINPHGLCPYSFVCFGIPTWRGFFTTNPFVIGSIVGVGILVLTPFLGRIFCGWLCPLGAIQEVLYRITNGRPKGRAKSVISEKWDRIFKYLKYLVLLMNIGLAYFLIQALYMNACPVIALSNIGNYLIISAVALFIMAVSSIFIERFGCRFLCPYGALMSLLLKVGNIIKLPRLMIKVNKVKCISCELCSSNCPMQIDVDDREHVSDSECILCQRCKEKCPLKGVDCGFCNDGAKDENK